MTTKSLAEITAEVCELKSTSEQVAYLKENNSKELRNILILMYDKKWSFSIPATPPPYKESVHRETHGMLYREARKLAYFVNEMTEGENLTQVRKESLFIQMLESVDADDAKLLVQMLAKKPFAQLTADTINEAFDGIISESVDMPPAKKKRGRPPKAKTTE